jgi:hypothetical protein
MRHVEAIDCVVRNEYWFTSPIDAFEGVGRLPTSSWAAGERLVASSGVWRQGIEREPWSA